MFFAYSPLLIGDWNKYATITLVSFVFAGTALILSLMFVLPVNILFLADFFLKQINTKNWQYFFRFKSIFYHHLIVLSIMLIVCRFAALKAILDQPTISNHTTCQIWMPGIFDINRQESKIVILFNKVHGVKWYFMFQFDFDSTSFGIRQVFRTSSVHGTVTVLLL